MCGICGIAYKDEARPADRSVIERMTTAIRHRGPDDHGYYLNNNIAFGHRRLAIVDLHHGQQPMSNSSETLSIACNGEIYNHLQIRRELEGRGFQYRTNSDTESIIHCIEAFGTAGLHRLRGMFAFAIHDRRSNRLLLARDRLGVKPLYYMDTPEFFAFASEIKSLLPIPGVTREVNEHTLLQILSLKYTCDDSTLFEGIKKLDPGHYLEYDKGSISIVRYWDCSQVTVDKSISEIDAARQLRSLMDTSIEQRLMSDVPLGLFLSGGIDSTIIGSRMASLIGKNISAFSVAFADRDANELPYARIAARHASALHHEVTMSTEEFFNLLPRMIYHEDEPIAFPSSVPLYKLSEFASQYIKVVLTGEGADELFGGYEKYYQTLNNLRADDMIFRFIPRSIRQNIFRPLINSLPYRFPYRNKAIRTAAYLDTDLQSIYLDNYATFSRPRLYELLGIGQGISLSIERVYAAYRGHFDRPSEFTFLSRMLYADIKTHLVELLMKQDQMSMAASIESRVPFLDHQLVEFAFSLPDDLKVKGTQTKRLLRRAFADDIPHEVLTRPKLGFPVPISRWFAHEYHDIARTMLLGKDSYCGDRFNRQAIENYFTLHRAGKYNYSDQIWSLVNLELWHKIFMQGVLWENIRLAA